MDGRGRWIVWVFKVYVLGIDGLEGHLRAPGGMRDMRIWDRIGYAGGMDGWRRDGWRESE